MKLKHKNKRYVIGSLLVLLQYIFFREFSIRFNVEVYMRNISFAIFVFLYFSEDIYSFKTCLIWEELKKQLKVCGEYLILIGIIVYQLKGIEAIPKYFLMGIMGLIYTFILCKIIRRVLYKYMKCNLLIIGVGESAKNLTEIVNKNNFAMYNILGYIDVNELFDQEKHIEENMILGSLNDINNIKENYKIDEVIVAIPNIEDRDMNYIVDKVEGDIEKIKFIPRINKMYTFNPQIQDYDGVMLISAKNYMLSKKRRILKRGLDIIGGLVGLGVLLPLYLIFGRKIKKDGGPILFGHNRIGRDLKPFKMYKFRSMYIDAEERLEKILDEDEELRKEFYSNFKLKDDPRITEAGKFLRKTSLDEFPQFINVIKGDMSLVGPRPVVQKEVDMYYGTEMGQKVFQAKPGITGMWQANGRSDIEDYDERIALDLYYIRNWSIWLDIIILIKTVKNVISRKGAY